MHIETILEPKFYDDQPSLIDKAKKNIKHNIYPRQQLSVILYDYNQHLGNDPVALQNTVKLQDPQSYCVVTGQQLGAFGGPVYTILKGISCLLLARQTGAIPIFWLATEDHDIAEIDHAYGTDDLGNLKRFHLSLPRNGTAVEDIKLTQKNIDEITAFWNFFGIKEFLPTVGEFYADWMSKMLVRIFAGTGMVFLEPKLLRPLSILFFKREIEECETIRHVLQNTSKHLIEAGYQTIINVEESTNLFLKNEQNKRLKLRFDGSSFTAGDEHFTLNELLSKIEKEPQSFSCNVAARPVLQNLLLPVIAYVAGPSEREYHRQLSEYHEFHGVAMPAIVPRLSATFIPQTAASVLGTAGLNPWNEIPTEVAGKEVLKKDLHYLRNLLRPHNEQQERLLNWWEFQSKIQENLVTGCLKMLSWDPSQHYYIYL